MFAGETIADSTAAQRVLETSHPPVYCFPPGDVSMAALEPHPRRTYCEFKGEAHYWTVVVGDRREEAAAWSYPEPSPGYEGIAGHVAFYLDRMDACCVDDERAKPQEGGFHGGWITSDVSGPFKGGSGTAGW